MDVLVSIAATPSSPSREGIAFVRDVADNGRSEQFLMQEAADARLLHRAMMLSATAETFEEALSSCLSVMCQITGWPIGHVWLPDVKRNRIVSSEIWHCTNEQQCRPLREATEGLELSSGEGFPGRIWERRQPCWGANLQTDQRVVLANELGEIGIKGTFGFPVTADGEIVAILEFFSPLEVAPSPKLLLLVSTLGHQLGRVFEQRQWDEERSRLAAIVDSSCDAIIGKTLDGRVTSWNSGAESVYGYTPEEAVGRPVSFLFPEGAVGEEPEIAAVVEHGVPLQQFETIRRRKDGRLIDVSITVSPIWNSSGNLVGTATIERNISDRKQRMAELRHAKEQAEQANLAKSEFLANISHELRTPMNAIIGMVELSLFDETLPARLRDYLDTARDSAHILLALLNDLLDFSRMEAGRFELEHDPFRIRRVVSEAMRILSLRAHEKGLELTHEVDADVPDLLEGDARRLRQIVINLVGNAIKFTEGGDVTVRVSVDSIDSDSTRLLIAVRDTGIGIPEDQQATIFAPFTQIDASTTRQQGGTGLGLAICRELVEKMGGKIWLESQLGHGTTFYCTPRFRVLDDDDTGPRSNGKFIREQRILVVDDNATNRRILEETLTRWGPRVSVATNGYEALEQIQAANAEKDPFTVLLVDALMPDMDGFTLIETLQTRPSMRGATILMLSSADRNTFEDRCRELAVKSFLEKPISQSTLHDAIATALNVEPPRAVTQRTISPAANPLRVLVAEDTPANRKVVEAILARRGHEPVTAANGREAVEKLISEDFDLILMDVQMPGMDGLQATQAVRKLDDPKKASIPIVAMTAHALKRDRQRCLEAGMDGYIAKPIDAATLINLVETTERRMSIQAQDASSDTSLNSGTPSMTPPATPTGEHPIINIDSALSRMGGNRNLLEDMANFFLEDSVQLCDQVEEGITAADAELAARSAHSLKGLASNFDAETLVVLSQQAERASQRHDFETARALLDALRTQVRLVSDALRQDVIGSSDTVEE
ncbi:Signal transduction histidine-protein kinase BarA [Maioricimonas rarisocia]|uniref:Sensory/regulatory protein RpfC n=2 Tax=Maioricimonas rarisocia TaxID=2528026 RepID=A0A517Z6S5_9PLAN|nr:Signal transduction histidine-protein kinase BarA [Maioricimonas rarisocia]